MIRSLPLKISFLTILCSLFLMPAMGALAAAGCCSHHGGVSGCNTSTNHQLCKDGTSSPTCLCGGGKSSRTQVKSKNTVTTRSTSTTTTPAAATTTVNMKTKGCCSKHGGVAKCDTASGHQMCKDGTISSTCKC